MLKKSLNAISNVLNEATESHLLVLEGESIPEPIAQYGAFVMNTEEEIREALWDYQKTKFGVRPWNRPDPVNERNSWKICPLS
ncbi:pirin-like C-terminal cupin domain-containing protein [Bacillus sp. T3]|uniref:pirin-like C-terminal cupin domain-containing protein n=1 Tax=Bacillus sp. T3 TaxID=467262 RepID=UPI0029811E6D|nr:pirin-like C-terminal cupin domain-containing protein [Bacillus sp. T3]